MTMLSDYDAHLPVDGIKRTSQIRSGLGLHRSEASCQTISPIIEDPFEPLGSNDRANVIIDSLKWSHEAGRAECLAYVVMPDHFHWVFRLGDCELSDVVASVSRFTSVRVNRLTGWGGAFWQGGFYDHAHRVSDTTSRHIRYVASNPVNAGLVQHPDQWPFTEVFPDW